MNCQRDVDPGEGKLFAQIFVCPECYAVAERLFTRGEEELKMLLLILKEAIRISIIKRELRFQERQVEDMRREDLLTHLHSLASEARKQQQEQEKQCPTPTPTKTRFKATMELPAQSADGKQSSDSTSGSD